MNRLLERIIFTGRLRSKSVRRTLPNTENTSSKELRGQLESVIALVGPIAAGKGTAAELLLNEGYHPFNYGDIIYEERTRRGLPEQRKHSNFVGGAVRELFGNDFIAKRLGQDIDKFIADGGRGRILIDGLRHPDEVKWVKENLGARVLGITANPEIRFNRMLRRNRTVDPKSRAEFDQVDMEDRGSYASNHKNQSDNCLPLADILIENNGENVDDYVTRVKNALHTLGVQFDNNQ